MKDNKGFEILQLIPVVKPLVAAFRGEQGIYVKDIYAIELVKFEDGCTIRFCLTYDGDDLVPPDSDDNFLGYAGTAKEGIEIYKDAVKKSKNSKRKYKSNVRKLMPKV